MSNIWIYSGKCETGEQVWGVSIYNSNTSDLALHKIFRYVI